MIAPLKPEERARMLTRGTTEEVDEFERLLSERFETDPSKPRTDAELASDAARTERLRILGEKLEAQ